MKKVLTIILVLLMVLGMAACGPSEQSSYQQTAQANEESAKAVLAGKSLPVLEDSLDWDNVAMRLEFLNQKGRIGWIYIFSSTGVLIAEEPVLNKLTSLNTYITPMEEIKGTKGSPITVSAPDLDGTYGTNAEGVFWFDPDGIYQELLLGGAFAIYSSERKAYDTPPLLQSAYK